MFLREMSGDTLEDVANKLGRDLRSWTGPAMDVEPHLEEEHPFFVLGDDRVQVPATVSTVKQFASFVGLPPKTALEFRDKGADLQQLAFKSYLDHIPHEVTVRFDDDGVHEMWKASLQRVPVDQLVQVAIDVIAPDAPVVEWSADAEEFYLDVVAPEDHDFGRVGGPGAVGDITAGGIVITQNRKANQAPQVNTKLFRLACTNGYESASSGRKVDSRGASVEEILAELNRMANQAFAEVEAQAHSFYETRNETIVGDPTQAMIRLADEYGLPERTSGALARRVPEVISGLDDGEELSMFHFINEITNFANQGPLTEHRNVRRTLYRAGGSLISEHHERCGTCRQRLI
jgi:hypothetical protein